MFSRHIYWLIASTFLAALMFSANSAHAEILIEGNDRVARSSITNLVTIDPSTYGDQEQLDRLTKTLLRTRLFEDVQIFKRGDDLVIIVIENPLVRKIFFEGNTIHVDRTLADQIRSRVSSVFSRSEAIADANSIEELYKSAGRHQTRVSPEIIEKEDNLVDLIFVVDEGKKTRISEITFIGNENISDIDLLDTITTTESNFLSFIKTSDIYDPQRIKFDSDLIVDFYNTVGYADARVISSTAFYDKAADQFNITFNISEGPKYRFGPPIISNSFREIASLQLDHLVTTDHNDVYNREEIEKSVNALQQELASQGTPNAEITPRTFRARDQGLITITYVIEKGPRLTIERIDVVGNDRTRDEVIRRELDFAEGDAYNKFLVEKARLRLLRLGFFLDVEIRQLQGTQPNTVALGVIVAEAPTGKVGFKLTFDTEKKTLIGVSISDKNYIGTGRFFSASVDVSKTTDSANFVVFDPRFLGSNVGAGFNVFYQHSKQRDTQRYSDKRYGVSVTGQISPTENIRLSSSYFVYQQDIKVTDFSTTPAAVQDLVGCIVPSDPNSIGGLFYPFTNSCIAEPSGFSKSSSSIVSAVKFGFKYSTIENPLNPRQGFNIDLESTIAGLGGDVKFWRATLDGHYFHELSPRAILIGRVQAGIADGWGGQELRIVDAFTRGPGLVRGFKEAGFGPRDFFSNDVLGGKLYYGASIEARTEIPGIPRELGLQFSVFADAGVLRDVPERAERTTLGTRPFGVFGGIVLNGIDENPKLRTSAGVGILWNSPFGPLTFSYAWPLSQDSRDRTKRFAFSGGYNF